MLSMNQVPMQMVGLLKSAFMSVEMPTYEVVATKDCFEERVYPAMKWVSTRVPSVSRDAAVKQMFWKLFNYMSGKNLSEQRIDMTAPVATRVDVCEGMSERSYTMSFYLPKEFHENTPPPLEDDVFLEDIPSRHVLVSTFGGFAKNEHWTEEALKLSEKVKDEEGAELAYHYTVGYDPPFKMFNRRNEIWIVKCVTPTS